MIFAGDVKKLPFGAMRIVLLFIFLSCFSIARSADSFFGFSAGISFAFGNKVNRIGVAASAYYSYEFVQLNSSINLLYNFQSLGLKKKTPELQLALGAEFGFGKKDSLRNNFVGLTENNMRYRNSVGYSYLRYFDKNQTTQSTGILDVNFQQFKIATENDLFGAGKGWRDRFRTGAFLIEYQYLDTKFAINSTMWTGDFTGCDNVSDSDYPARFGYRLVEKAQHGNYSLGLLSLQVKQFLPFTQVAQLNIGIDSEQVRHFLQNKLAHDQRFFKEKWIKEKQFHIPMIASDGGQYIFGEDQKIRPVSFYFNLGMNSGVFY